MTTIAEVKRRIETARKRPAVVYLPQEECASLWQEMQSLKRTGDPVGWDHQGMAICGVPVKPLHVL